MSDFSITQSLFGVDPAAVSRAEQLLQDKRDAEFVKMDPMEQANFMRLQGGRQLGQGIAKVAGGLMGQDVEEPRLKLARTTQGILKQLQDEGFDPNDTFRVRKELAVRLGQAGFSREAALLAQEVQATEVATNLKRAQTVAHAAAAQKDVVDATRTPVVRLAETGKFTPESLAMFRASGDIKDLVMKDPDSYMTVETKDGVYLVNKNDPKDKVRMGDTKPTAGAADFQVRLDFQSALKSAYEKWGRDGAEADVVMERMRKNDPQGFANLMALGKGAVGADNVLTALGEAKPLTAEQNNLFDFGSAAITGRAIWERKGWGSTRKLPDLTEVINSVQAAASKDPNTKMPLQVLLDKYGDANTREYLADAFGMLLPVLREDTGAAIANSEWVNYFNTYIPASNANASDNASRMERINGRVNALEAQINADPNIRRRIDRLKAAEVKRTAGAELIKAGRKAKEGGAEAYKAWFLGLTKDEQNLVREMVKK